MTRAVRRVSIKPQGGASKTVIRECSTSLRSEITSVFWERSSRRSGILTEMNNKYRVTQGRRGGEAEKGEISKFRSHDARVIHDVSGTSGVDWIAPMWFA